MGSEKTQTEVMILHSLVRSMNGTVVNAVTLRDFSGCQQPPVIQIAYYPGPFPRSFGAKIQAVQSKRAPDSWQSFDHGDFLPCSFMRFGGSANRHSQLLFRQLAIKIMLSTQRSENRISLCEFATRLQGAGFPIAPYARLLFHRR